MKIIPTFEEFVFTSINEERIKNVIDLEKELIDKSINYTEIDKTDRFIWKIKNGKKVVATYEPGPKWLNLKSVIIKSEQKVATPIDLEIHSLLSDWVISSLDEYKKRDIIARKLLALDIPEDYKKVDGKFLYRLIGINEDINNLKEIELNKEGIARSWAYHMFGVEKMKDWYFDIYGTEHYRNMIIIKKPVANVIINIPEFYNTHPDLIIGKKHSSLIFSEYEVICENKSPLLKVKNNEWEITKL